MTTQQTIALNKLVPSKANVRVTGRKEGISELAASIAAHGLRQNLNVLPSQDGKRFEVVAGARRLLAMKQLAKVGKLAKDAPIPCLVLGEGDDAAEISLAENAMRTAMHPDDQFEAFRALIEGKGLSVEEVAARFGVTPAVVRQRLKLANVSPKLRALFRQGEMGLDHVMALAISDDHGAQEEAWENLPDWNREPSLLKDALTHETVPMTDRLARFVGVEAYLAAGGSIIRDLFDDEDEGYLSDRALVTRLTTAKLEAAMDLIRAEGWKWVKAEAVRDHSVAYGRLWPVYSSDDEEAEADADEADEAASDEEQDEDLYEDQGAFAAEDMARAGAVLMVGHDGALRIDRGLIHPDDAKAEAKREGGGKAAGSSNPAGYSAALVEELTAHRTAALRMALAQKPAIALAVTVHALSLSLLYVGPSGSCLVLRATSDDLERQTKAPGDCPAHQAMLDEKASWGERLPGDESDLLAWCLAQPQDTLLDLLAFLAGLSVNAVYGKQGRDERIDHADRLAEALALDMAAWWNPSLEGFYQRLPKAALTQAIAEAKVPHPGVDFGKVKKAEAARLVAKAISGSGWVPEPLRIKT